MKKTICVGLILLLATGLCHTQSSLSSGERKMRGIDTMLAHHGITREMSQRMKEKGLNLRDELRYRTKPFEVVNVFVFDVVVVGKVKRMIDLPAPRTDPFHSKAVVEVSQVLKGLSPDTKEIEVLRESGPLTGEGDVRLRTSLEASLVVGEEAVFFLEKIGTATYIQTPFRTYFRNHPDKYSSDALWLEGGAKLSIKNGEIFDEHLKQYRSISTVIQNMKDALQLLAN